MFKKIKSFSERSKKQKSKTNKKKCSQRTICLWGNGVNTQAEWEKWKQSYGVASVFQLSHLGHKTNEAFLNRSVVIKVKGNKVTYLGIVPHGGG